jgi:hypothetical protein
VSSILISRRMQRQMPRYSIRANTCVPTFEEDIRHNRGNVAERLGFLGRLVHGHNPRAWLKELKSCLGEVVDYAEALD